MLLNQVTGANQTLTLDAVDHSSLAAKTVNVALVDQTKPTITNVQALNSKTIVVSYSEPVVDDITGANIKAANGKFAFADSAKYTLYNKTTGTSVPLTSDANVNSIQVTATFANADKTQVKFNIVSVGANVTGLPNGGLSNGGYIFYASNVNDVAPIGNTIVAGSAMEFNGSLAPDTLSPALLSSTFNNASGTVTLVFDKPTTGVAPANDKLYFQVGANKVLLKAADYVGIAGTNSLTFTLPVATLTNVNALGAAPQLVLEAGAFTDGTNTTLAVTSTPTITTAPILTSVSYDENTNIAVYTFSKTINVSKILTFVGNQFKIAGVDIQDVGLVFNTTENSKTLSFKLSDAKAQAVEAAFRLAPTTSVGYVNAGEVTDLDGVTNAVASSSVAMTVGTSYIKDMTAPTLANAKYNADTKVLELGFNEAIRNTVGDFVGASVELYKDDNGVAGLQTSIVNGVAADSKIATFADTDAAATVSAQAIVQADLRTDATGASAATATTEKSTIYIKDQADAVLLQTTLDAVPATTDVYVNILAGGVKDPSANVTTTVQSVKLSSIAVSNAAAVTADTTTVVNNNGSLTVQFKNATGPVSMDAATATNPANYNVYLTSNPLAKAQIESISMNATNTEATILLSTPLVASQGYSYTTSGIKTASGAAGNIDGTIILAETLTAGAGPDTAVLSATQNVALTDKDNSGTVNAGDTIAISFNEAVKLPSGFSASDITVSNSHSLGNSAVALSADKKTLTITVGSGTTIAALDTLTFPTTIKDYEGNALASGAGQTSNGMTVAGNVAPTILSAIYADANIDGLINTGDTLTVKFNQNLKLDTNKTALDLINDITEGGTTFTAATLAGDTVTFTVGTAGFAIGDSVVVNGVAGNVDLVNSWGTKAVDAVGKAITKSDVTAPTVTGFNYNSTTRTMTVSFSEAVQVTDAGAGALAKVLAAKLNVTAGSLGTVGSISGGTLSTDKKSFSFVLHTDAALDQYSTITVSAGAITDGVVTNVIEDASGNDAIRGQGTAYSLTITQ